MHIKSFIACAGIFILVGCSATFHLYPVQGPLSNQKPSPVLVGVKTGFASGTLSIILPGGESCAGPWSLVRPLQGKGSDDQVKSPTEHDLSSTWDSIFGSGFYVANVLGARQYARSILIGNQGSTVYLELYSSEVEHSPVLGVAQDNKGNTYKVTF
jgi:hypothetical protein